MGGRYELASLLWLKIMYETREMSAFKLCIYVARVLVTEPTCLASNRVQSSKRTLRYVELWKAYLNKVGFQPDPLA